jgi:hypothetical protein
MIYPLACKAFAVFSQKWSVLELFQVRVIVSAGRCSKPARRKDDVLRILHVEGFRAEL